MGKIRDFFFPMIDKPAKDEIEKEQELYSSIEKDIMNYQFRDGEAELMMKYADDYEKREDARLHEVESKATVFIGTFSVAVTILMSLLKEFMPGLSSQPVLNKTPIWFGIIIFLLLGLAIFYLCFAIIHSVKTLQRNTFNVLGVRETLNAGLYPPFIIEPNKDSNKKSGNNLDNKKAEIARKKFLYTFRNKNVINKKVEHMTLAQEFFMHAVVVLIMIILFLAGYVVLQKIGNHIISLMNMINKLMLENNGNTSQIFNVFYRYS